MANFYGIAMVNGKQVKKITGKAVKDCCTKFAMIQWNFEEYARKNGFREMVELDTYQCNRWQGNHIAFKNAKGEVMLWVLVGAHYMDAQRV